MNGQIETYFEKVNGTGLSADFKDMILRLFSYDGTKRYNIEELKNHPWLNSATFNKEAVRATLLGNLQKKSVPKGSPFQQ